MKRRALVVVLAVAAFPASVRGQGSPLGPEFRVNTFTTGWQYTAAGRSIASDSAGNFVVVWTDLAQVTFLGTIFGQRYSVSGAPLGKEFQVNNTLAAFGPSVASDPTGNFVVVWTGSESGATREIFGQRYAGSGAPLGPEFRVSTYTAWDQEFPSVATDAQGNFVVAWHGGGPSGLSDISARRYAGTGVPTGPEFRVNSYSTGDQGAPDVAMAPGGDFVVTWESYWQDGSYRGIFGQRFGASGAPLGPEFRVNTYTTSWQFDPSVSMDSAGNFVVIWESFQSPGVGIYGQRYAASGAPLAPEFGVSPNGQSYASVASDPSGNLVVAWKANQEILAQRFDSSGAPLGDSFRVNTYTTENQAYPSVAADATGRFVVVWDSMLQDGSDFGVFGQRFGPIVPVELTRFTVE